MNTVLKIGTMAVVALNLSAIQTFATTWDEPWQKDIIENSGALVRARITKAEPNRVEFVLTKQLAGEKVETNGALIGFSQLKFGSYSVKEDVFRLREGQEYYLFVAFTGEAGEYKIATPTSGYALTRDGRTTATYRHSYHQAYVPDEIYEMSMTAIFRTLKNEETDLAAVKQFISEELSNEPANIPNDVASDEFQRFCRQHAALESLYYLGGGDAAQLKQFLEHENRHGQISAVRALGRLPKEASSGPLLAFIADEDRDAFAKVMAVWALRDMQAMESSQELQRIIETTTDQETGFGGNLMDPRIGTSFPGSVHSAIMDVLNTWNAASNTPGEAIGNPSRGER